MRQMHKFQVWAPKPKSVSVEVSGSNYPMERDKRGWWTARVESAGPGSDYGFHLNGGPARPDPRSPFQPNGVNALSRLVDHAAFKWSDTLFQAKPLSSAVIYELHIGTFTPEGTFRATIDKLDYLAELGITHLELMPVNEFSGPWGWGYDGVDLYAPYHAYGTPDDLKTLVDACHGKGMAMLLDVVYNHFGPDGNYLPEFGPYFTDRYSTPWGPAVNLDQNGSHEVRRLLLDNALMWLHDYHFDGLRLDAIHAYQDDSAIHFLEQLSSEVDEMAAHLGRHLVLIAESDLNDPRVVRSRDAHGWGMDAQWSDDLHHALHSVLTGETSGYYEDFGELEDLAKALKEGYVYSGDYSANRRRVHGRRALGLSGHRFLAYSQTHDQVGNRARGERLSQLLSPGLQKIAAALVLMSPFVPMLFMGEEFSASTPFQYFTQHEDRQLGLNVSEGRKNEFVAFGWDPNQIPDPQDEETFLRSKLDWSEVGRGVHVEMLDWYKRLIAVRKQLPALTDGRLEEVGACYSESDCWFVLTRGPVQVACNLSRMVRPVPMKAGMEEVLSSDVSCRVINGSLEMPPESVCILTMIA
jgi:maltooligosyltrehalose trehalohydrolase